MTLKQAKAEATRAEKRRVFDSMNMPRDIVVIWNDQIWRRDAWTSLNQFGWAKWEHVNLPMHRA